MRDLSEGSRQDHPLPAPPPARAWVLVCGAEEQVHHAEGGVLHDDPEDNDEHVNGGRGRGHLVAQRYQDDPQVGREGLPAWMRAARVGDAARLGARLGVQRGRLRGEEKAARST